MNHTTASLRTAFADPPREFGIMPFWFWNDDLQDDEVRRQIVAFHDKGFGGFIPHARIGLSRRVGYLTDEYFRLIRIAVEEAERLGMKVVLYDEGSYPSGSAQGRVVAENPAYAARCLISMQRTVTGPATGYWRPNPGRALQDTMVSVVVGREAATDVLDPDSLTLLTPESRDLVRYDVPEGTWRLIACWAVFSGGTIRGVFDEEEDTHAQAPAAGDIMNADAVSCFLRHTHDRYYKHVGDYFGTTVVAMFTDEPSAMGRGVRRGPDPKAYTPGFLDDVQAVWDDDVHRWLPALWVDCGPRTGAFRHVYDRAAHDRVARVFYGAQRDWCVRYGIALTGHPGHSNEMGALRYFQWPGQDMVWRYVEPGSSTALEGAHSVAPKAASSAAVIRGCRRNASEALGAYGWRLTLDEAKWLVDWHMVRGNNLFFLHACFYSIRGRRAFESEPDIGIHNVWWPYFGVLADYMRRVCWALTDGTEVCDVAILTDPNNMAWEAAAVLLQEQIDFIYIDDVVLEQARIDRESLAVGTHRFRVIVCDPPEIVNMKTRRILDEFRDAGGLVMGSISPDFVAIIVDAMGRDVHWPDARNLRMLHYRREGRELYFLVNEGEEPLEGSLSLASTGALELWDPMAGCMYPWPGTIIDGRLHTTLRLERRQGQILSIDPQGECKSHGLLPSRPGDIIAELSGPWTVTDMNNQPVSAPCPGDWARVRAWETFSGTLRYQTECEIHREVLEDGGLFLDLGRVGDIAEVLVNDRPSGVCAWSPYILEISGVCRPGQNRIEIRVTNSMANTCDGLQMPSGLLEKVILRRRSKRT